MANEILEEFREIMEDFYMMARIDFDEKYPEYMEKNVDTLIMRIFESVYLRGAVNHDVFHRFHSLLEDIQELHIDDFNEKYPEYAGNFKDNIELIEFDKLFGDEL